MIAADLQSKFAADGVPLAQDASEHSRSVDIWNAEPNHLLLRLQATPADDLVVDRQHAPRITQDFRPAFGKADTGKAFLDQISADHGLEPPHMGAHRRLSEIEKMGGLGEAAEFTNGDEGAQQVRRDIGHPGRGGFAARLLLRHIVVAVATFTHQACSSVAWPSRVPILGSRAVPAICTRAARSPVPTTDAASSYRNFALKKPKRALVLPHYNRASIQTI